MDKKSKIVKFIAVLLLALTLSGCWNSKELDELAIVMGYGIDTGTDAGMIDMTAQIAVLQSSSGGGSSGGSSESSGDQSYWNITRTGSSVFSILRDYTHESSRKLYSPHTQVLIYGEDLAKRGVRDSLDFFLRDHETRMTVWLLVAKGRASDIFKVKSKLNSEPALNIAELVKAQTNTSETPQIKILDFVKRLLSDTTAPIAPIVEVSNDGSNSSIEVSGTAVFDQDKMIGELDKAQTRGLLWVLGEVKSGIVQIDAPGGSADIEISNAMSDQSVELLDDGSVKVHVTITASGNVGSQTGSETLTTPENIKILEQNFSQRITDEVYTCLNKAKELDADIYGFGDMVYKKYPKQWESMKDNWDEIFKNIDLELEVKVAIRGSGRIVKPAYPSEED